MSKALYLAITDIIMRHKKDVNKKKLEKLVNEIVELVDRG